MDKIIKKSQYTSKQRKEQDTPLITNQPNQHQPQGSGPATNTRSQSGKTTNVAQKVQEIDKKEPLMAKGESSNKPQQFKPDDRVVLQSVISDTAFDGTVRWVGEIAIEGHPTAFVGIETVSDILFLLR